MIKEETPQYIVNLEINLKSFIKEEVGGLAASTARGFRLIDKRFEAMDEKLDGIDGRLDGIDERLDGIDSRLDGVDGRLGGIDGRLDGIDGRLDGIDNRLDGIDSKLVKHDIEFEGINNRLDRIESDNRDNKESIGKIEGHIGRYEVRAQNIEAILIEDHKPRIKDLENVVFAI